MSGLRSRRKGHDFERWVAGKLREVFGDNAVKRGLQSRTGEEVPDVECPVFWTECKREKRTNPKAALAQAAAACPRGRIAIAICKDDRQEPTVTLSFDDFLDFAKEWWELSQR